MSASGTSAAAAFVSGVTALYVASHPDLSPADIRSALIRTAKDKGEKGFDPAYGYGILQEPDVFIK